MDFEDVIAEGKEIHLRDKSIRAAQSVWMEYRVPTYL